MREISLIVRNADYAARSASKDERIHQRVLRGIRDRYAYQAGDSMQRAAARSFPFHASNPGSVTAASCRVVLASNVGGGA